MKMISIIIILLSFALLFSIFELIRRRMLLERYSILWFLFCIVMLVLSFKQNILEAISGFMNIFYPPAALFFFGLTFIIIILVHFSTVISKLMEQNKKLTQLVSLLRLKINDIENAIK